MRTKEIRIGKVTYLMVMNNAVLEGMEERGISLQDIGGDKPVSNLLSLLFLMIKGGSDYAALTGQGDYPVIEEKALAILTGPEDYADFLAAITEVATGDRRVDATPPKNAAAAPAGEAPAD